MFITSAYLVYFVPRSPLKKMGICGCPRASGPWIAFTAAFPFISHSHPHSLASAQSLALHTSKSTDCRIRSDRETSGYYPFQPLEKKTTVRSSSFPQFFTRLTHLDSPLVRVIGQPPNSTFGLNHFKSSARSQEHPTLDTTVKQRQ